MNNSAIFDGRHVAVTSAANVFRGSVPMILDEVASVVTRREDAPFIAVLYGQDLGASVSVMVDLRTEELVFVASRTSDALATIWKDICITIARAEALFNEEMEAMTR